MDHHNVEQMPAKVDVVFKEKHGGKKRKQNTNPIWPLWTFFIDFSFHTKYGIEIDEGFSYLLFMWRAETKYFGTLSYCWCNKVLLVLSHALWAAWNKHAEFAFFNIKAKVIWKYTMKHPTDFLKIVFSTNNQFFFCEVRIHGSCFLVVIILFFLRNYLGTWRHKNSHSRTTTKL